MKILNIIILVYFLYNCSSSNKNEGIELNSKDKIEFVIDNCLKSLSSKEINQIKTITTNNGLNSLFEWSDSLRNEEFINLINDKLNSREFLFLDNGDFNFTLLIGNIDGLNPELPQGHLFFRKVGNKYLIDQYSADFYYPRRSSNFH
jgi:hypothetical protein